MTESQDAFDELLATLREVGDRFAGDEWGLTDPGDVAEGLRVIVHHLATAVETQFEQDAAHPTFREIVTPWRKALGDNADARYHDAVVHPGHGPDTTIGRERQTNPFVLEYVLRSRT